jgi:hypothetical protein
VREPERGAAWIVEGLLTEREMGHLGGGIHALPSQWPRSRRTSGRTVRGCDEEGALTPTGAVTLAGTLPRMNLKLTR